MTRILAVDPSSTALGLYDGERARTIATTAKMLRPERLGHMLDALYQDFVQAGGYDFVVYEEQFVRGGAATKAIYGAVGIVEAIATSSGAGVMPLPQSSVREWAQKKAEWAGRLKRDDIKQVYAIVAKTLAPAGTVFNTQDEMDAACLYYFVREKGIVENG